MPGSILTCSTTRQAAAVGSTKTAVRSSIESGTSCRFAGGSERVLGEGAVAAADAEDRAHVAVSPARRAASGTGAAADGDLAGDAAPDPLRAGRSRLDDADELVAGHA